MNESEWKILFFYILYELEISQSIYFNQKRRRKRTLWLMKYVYVRRSLLAINNNFYLTNVTVWNRLFWICRNFYVEPYNNKCIILGITQLLCSIISKQIYHLMIVMSHREFKDVYLFRGIVWISTNDSQQIKGKSNTLHNETRLIILRYFYHPNIWEFVKIRWIICFFPYFKNVTAMCGWLFYDFRTVKNWTLFLKFFFIILFCEG